MFGRFVGLRFVLFVASSTLALAVGRPCPAHAGDAEAADRLFQEALALQDKGDWASACPRFRDSYAADPSVGALLNVAACSEREGKLLRAKEEYGAALALNLKSSDPARREAVRKEAEAALAKLDARIPSIVVSVEPKQARVSIDGGAPVASGAASRVDPGSHTLRVEADGFAPTERTVDVSESQRLVLEMTLSPGLSIASPPPEDDSPKSLLVPGLLVGGLGLALAATGGGLLGVAAGKAGEIRDLCGDDADPPLCNGTMEDAAAATRLSEEGRPFEISGGALVALGAGLLISSAATLIGDAARSDAPVRASVLPILGPREVGCSIVLGF